MEKFNIAIIKPNRNLYQQHEFTHARFSDEKILEDIEDFIEFEKISSDMLIDTIKNKITSDVNNIIYTTVCYEDLNYKYEMVHIINNDNKYEQNNISTQLGRSRMRIVNNSILIKINNMNKGTNINIDDIVKIYKSYLVHNGVKICKNGNIDNIKYIFNPIDWTNESERSKYKFYEIDLDELVMMVFIKNDESEINEKASILSSKIVYGDVIVSMRYKMEELSDTQYDYCDLDNEIIDKLIAIYSQNNIENDNTDKNASFYSKLNKNYDKFVKKYGKVVYINEKLDIIKKQD